MPCSVCWNRDEHTFWTYTRFLWSSAAKAGWPMGQERLVHERRFLKDLASANSRLLTIHNKKSRDWSVLIFIYSMDYKWFQWNSMYITCEYFLHARDKSLHPYYSLSTCMARNYSNSQLKVASIVWAGDGHTYPSVTFWMGSHLCVWF